MSEIEAELKQYLASKQLGDVMNDIVLQLLQAKPENPVLFMVEYLCSTYPDRCTSVTLTKSPSKTAVMETEAGSDDDNDDDVADEPVKQVKSKGRKTGVSAESMDPEKMKEGNRFPFCFFDSLIYSFIYCRYEKHYVYTKE